MAAAIGVGAARGAGVGTLACGGAVAVNIDVVATSVQAPTASTPNAASPSATSARWPGRFARAVAAGGGTWGSS